MLPYIIKFQENTSSEKAYHGLNLRLKKDDHVGGSNKASILAWFHQGGDVHSSQEQENYTKKKKLDRHQALEKNQQFNPNIVDKSDNQLSSSFSSQFIGCKDTFTYKRDGGPSANIYLVQKTIL